MARADIGYDFEDFGKDEAWLKAKYGEAGHPEFTLENWRQAEDQMNGYWDWVIDGIKGDDDTVGATDADHAAAKQFIDNVVQLPTQAKEPVQQGQGQPSPDDLVAISNIDQFAYQIAAWHKRQVALCEHMLAIPPGTEIDSQINQEEPVKLKLTGDIREAFRAGISFALTQLGNLPFGFIEEDAPDGTGAPEAGNDPQG